MRLVYEPLLPNGYTRLEYLESNSSQNVAYIALNYKPTTNTNLEIKLRYNGVSNTTNFTTWALGATTWCGIHSIESEQKIGITCGTANANKVYYTPYAKGTDITLKLEGTSVYANGSLVGTITKLNATSNLDVFRYYNSSNLWFPGRIYYLKIWDGTTTINLIPALNSSNEPGFYDTVSGTFYTNAGSGSFVYTLPEEDDNTIDNPKYQQVEYLESHYIDNTTGGYINTGYYPNNNTKLEVLASGISANSFSVSNGTWFFGGRQAYQQKMFGSYYDQSSQKLNSAFGSSMNSSSYSSTNMYGDNKKIVLDSTGLYINDTKIVTNASTANFTSPAPLTLFALNNNGSVLSQTNYKIHYCKIWDNGILVRHLIPVLRKVDNVPGMYDKITGIFYTNGGTVDFTYGDKVNQSLPSGYEKLKYLQTMANNNQQYIDTGLFINDTCGFKIDCQYSQADDKAMIGVKGDGSSRWAYLESGGQSYISWNGIYGFNAATTSRHTIEMNYYNNRKRIFDGIEQEAITQELSAAASDLSVCLFAAKWGSESNKLFASGKIYSAKITKGNKLIGDYVPALRKSDNKPGMYDLISNQFLVNQGSGADFTYEKYPKPLSNSKFRIPYIAGNDYDTTIDGLYAPLEYLENTSGVWAEAGSGMPSNVGSYINTGIHPKNTGIVKMGLMLNKGGNNPYQCLFGAYDSNSKNFGIVIQNNITYFMDGGQTAVGDTWERDTYYDIEFNATQKTLTKNGVSKTYSVSGLSGTSNLSIYLFTDNSVGGSMDQYDTTYTMMGKIYYFKYYEGDTLVNNFIPVLRKSDGVPGMYDTINHTFCTNQGIGNFSYIRAKKIAPRYVAGGYVASIYKPLQYLQASGEQYIDTGIALEDIYGFKLSYNGNNSVTKPIIGRSDATFAYSTYFATHTYLRMNGAQVYANLPSDDLTSLDMIMTVKEGNYELKKNGGTIYVSGSYNVETQHIGANYPLGQFTDTCCLFGVPSWRYSNAKIYECVFYDINENVIHDYVPVLRIIDNKPGMYDKVTGTFLTNSGTGDFTYA